MGQPLDKQKAFLYGRFVQAAYTMFRDPQGGDPLRPQPAGIPEGYELGAWIHMSDFILNLKEPEFYGIVCRKIDNPDWRIVAIRGTEGAIEWIDDAAALPRPFRQVPDTGRVASGFDKIYSSLKVVKRRLAEDRAVAAAAPGLPAPPETFDGSFAEQLDQLASSRELARGVTNTDGRLANLLPDGVPLEAGVYRLSFATGAYFLALGMRGFYPEVQVMVRIDDPAGHYHVPLLLSPYGYSTYRGS